MKAYIWGIAIAVILCGGCGSSKDNPSATANQSNNAVSSSDLAAPSEVPKDLQGLRLTKSQAEKVNRWLQQHGPTPNPAEYARFVQSILRPDQQAEFQKLTQGSR